MKKEESSACLSKRLLPMVNFDWREINELNFLSISSNGSEFGLKWMKNLEREYMSSVARSQLISQFFEGRKKKKFELVFLSDVHFGNAECKTTEVIEFAKKNRLDSLDLAVFPLLCELFSFQIDELVRPSTVILMHKELRDRFGRPMQLAIELLPKSIGITQYVDMCDEKKFTGEVYFVFSA